MIKPIISVVVVVYNMRRQAMNTLYSLSTRHQRNVSASDYEIIVVENHSSETLQESEVLSLGNNFHYFLRHELTSQSPVGALNFGVEQANGQMVCLMIDGARMVTPRIIEYALLAQRIDQHALISVPGYSLGWQDQRFHREALYDQSVETELLASTQWQHNGYRLFDIATISGANPNGVFNPFMECNCIFTSLENFIKIGRANMDFQLPGGGSINLHLYRQLGMLDSTRHYIVMAGEGSFHQFHGGVTTAQWDDLDDVLASHRKQLHSYWDNDFHSLRREPMLIGAVTSHAQQFLHYSSVKAKRRFMRIAKDQRPIWPDETNIALAPLNY